MIRKIGIGFFGFMLIAGIVLAGWYRIDGQPLPETNAFLQPDGYTVSEHIDGSLTFQPDAANGQGLLIMHGALIKPKSYAATAAFFAQRGFTVLLPFGEARLSILAIDPAAARMAELSLDSWTVIGHSMGGLSSLELISRHPLNIRAAALWGAAMPKDFSALTVPLLHLWGNHDGLLPPERFADTRKNLPTTTEFVTVDGGNHQNFAMYSHQFFDNPGSISWRQQIDIANKLTVAFFERQSTAADD
jgi:pimeloyl-ACP methyl ester carboxylesterase